MPQILGHPYVKETILKLKHNQTPHTNMGNFQHTTVLMDRSTRQNSKRQIRELTHIMTQMDLTDI